MIQISTKAKIDEIKDLHSLAVSYAEKAIGHAFRIGELLTEIKGTLQHGQWIPWVEKHLPFNVRQAQNYMRMYNSRNELTNTQHASHLPMREAVKMIASQKPKKEPVKVEAELVDEEDIEVNTPDTSNWDNLDEPEEEDKARRKQKKEQEKANRKAARCKK